jgi:adenylate cyclase
MADEDRKRLKPSITTALVFGFGALIVVGMVVVLAISMWSAQKNTRSLLADNARLAMLSLIRETRRQLNPVMSTNAYVAELINAKRIDTDDAEDIATALLTAMAGAEQVYGMAFIHPDGSNIRVRRGVGRLPDAAVAATPLFAASIAEAREHRNPYWGRPIWLEGPKTTVISVRTPIWEGDTFRGVLVAGVAVNALSRFIARSSGGPLTGNRFILYGRDHVLAHTNMAAGGYKRHPDIPLPRLDEVDDRAVANIWNTENRGRLLFQLDSATKGHWARIDGDPHIFLYRQLTDFGDTPLLVGNYVGSDDGLGVELNRLVWSGVAAIAVILLCVAGAVVLGRRMSAPIRQLAEGSQAVAELDLESVPRLRPSRLRELDDAAAAFNRMTTGLRWFGTYVPRNLVDRLIERDAPFDSEEKTVTVMFTDIAGFATLSEHMPAAETAELLNTHFTILARCIEEEGGTVDKYIGDSVMAFWEPGADGPGVDRALRAADAIRAGVAAENVRRAGLGQPDVEVRIGIHTGPAIVGNIGAPGRMNYTLVGDTVNVAARLEQFCKDYSGRDGSTILISGETAALSSRRGALAALGRRAVRGRDGEIEVFSLLNKSGGSGLRPLRGLSPLPATQRQYPHGWPGGGEGRRRHQTRFKKKTARRAGRFRFDTNCRRSQPPRTVSSLAVAASTSSFSTSANSLTRRSSAASYICRSL